MVHVFEIVVVPNNLVFWSLTMILQSFFHPAFSPTAHIAPSKYSCERGGVRLKVGRLHHYASDCWPVYQYRGRAHGVYVVDFQCWLLSLSSRWNDKIRKRPAMKLAQPRYFSRNEEPWQRIYREEKQWSEDWYSLKDFPSLVGRGYFFQMDILCHPLKAPVYDSTHKRLVLLDS